MSRVVISDTSCLIALDRIHRLTILKETFQQILTTVEVQHEFGQELPAWITVTEVQNKIKKKELENLVDAGEASAIALALETKNCILIIDEKKGRRIARELHVEIIGTLRMLLLSKEREVISSVREVIEALEKNGFRFSSGIKNEILREAKELKE